MHVFLVDNLTFNFNSLLGIVYCSFSMQIPTVEKCDFDRQFLFGEYVAISHRYDLKRVSLRRCLATFFVNCLATFMMHDSLLNFHSVFLDTLYNKFMEIPNILQNNFSHG